HAAQIPIYHRAVERMGHLADETDGAAARQTCVGVERDDVADAVAELCKLVGGDDETGVACAAQQAVQFMELAALALPAHPFALRRIPAAAAMEQEETLFAVTGVEFVYSLLRRFEQWLVVDGGLAVAVFPVGEERKEQVAIGVGKI